MQHEPGELHRSLTLHDDPVVSAVAKYFAADSATLGVARPIRLSDYESLAAQCGWKYLGVGVDVDHVQIQDIPGSVFHSTAVLEALDSAGASDSSEKKRELRSFWSLHFELQRRMPTTRNLRWAADTLEQTLERLPTVDELCAMFPACSGSMVRDLWEKSCEARDVNDVAASFVRTAIQHVYEDECLRDDGAGHSTSCLLYTSPSPRD